MGASGAYEYSYSWVVSYHEPPSTDGQAARGSIHAKRAVLRAERADPSHGGDAVPQGLGFGVQGLGLGV